MTFRYCLSAGDGFFVFIVLYKACIFFFLLIFLKMKNAMFVASREFGNHLVGGEITALSLPFLIDSTKATKCLNIRLKMTFWGIFFIMYGLGTGSSLELCTFSVLSIVKRLNKQKNTQKYCS